MNMQVQVLCMQPLLLQPQHVLAIRQALQKDGRVLFLLYHNPDIADLLCLATTHCGQCPSALDEAVQVQHPPSRWRYVGAGTLYPSGMIAFEKAFCRTRLRNDEEEPLSPDETYHWTCKVGRRLEELGFIRASVHA